MAAVVQRVEQIERLSQQSHRESCRHQLQNGVLQYATSDWFMKAEHLLTGLYCFDAEDE